MDIEDSGNLINDIIPDQTKDKDTKKKKIFLKNKKWSK